ncbi:hypothetical protein AA12717_0508 [Gluconacetobacter sacchari DSM 12717]|uniref:Integrating conjugative element protein n=2 Tax=Gluconacetobacter sacchari TaxID=92759 RepID=A0A7W4IGZ7_9PROT|nr:integrating conjugative element protein [Gluconacetobacter sacchari]GBQ20244.1 hypothetical protein AA12717_0508 [Gluconacetobacter sacchari DSM 12717]
MTRGVLHMALALPCWLVPASGIAQSSPLIIVEDHGGAPAQPYYEALTSESAETPPPPFTSPPRTGEGTMLPVRSTLLSPGDVQPREIQAPGLTPFFVIGDDERSRQWLRLRAARLRSLHAVGLVVNVATTEALAALRALAPDLLLSPTPGDDLAQRLGLRTYPALITATGIEP